MTQPQIRSYRDLLVWQRSMQLAEECYVVVACFPIEERFGLAQQIRRAAVSIPANVAEGHNGRTRQVFLNHLSIALGSQAELETELELSARLLKADVARAQGLAAEVGRLLHGLLSTLARPTSPRKSSYFRVIPQ